MKTFAIMVTFLLFGATYGMADDNRVGKDDMVSSGAVSLEQIDDSEAPWYYPQDYRDRYGRHYEAIGCPFGTSISYMDTDLCLEQAWRDVSVLLDIDYSSRDMVAYARARAAMAAMSRKLDALEGQLKLAGKKDLLLQIDDIRGFLPSITKDLQKWQDFRVNNPEG